MNQKVTIVLLGLVLLAAVCITMTPSFFSAGRKAEESVPVLTAPQPVAEDTPAEPLPDSVLYYGKVEKIIQDETGNITALRLSSERYGDYAMKLSEETVWIDSAERIVSDRATLAEGERLYVFHSAIATFSMPPQSAAFAIVRNVPQDAGCAQYMKVNSVEKKADSLHITANNGTVSFKTDSNTTFSPYLTRNIVTGDDIRENSRIMVWFANSGTEEDLLASHIILLPES